jgi:hypothetical protein
MLVLTITALAGACTSEQPEAETITDAPATVGTAQAAKPRRPAPEGAAVYFVAPKDGAIVSSPVHVEFAVVGMHLAPAGNDVENSGHHHVLIDTDPPDMALPIPSDAKHVHFGDGSATAELELQPGEHTLQLLFADYLHIPHDAPVYSERITITVE